MRFIKEIVKSILYRPRGVIFGERSLILRPFTVRGASRIRIGKRTFVHGGAHFEAIESYAGVTHNPSIEIGDGVYIGGHAYFTAVDCICIGDGCVLSEYVYITDEIHGMNPRGGPIMEQALISKGPVTIGANCFLGFRAAVMPGVTLGEHCVVGANSTVTRSFPAYSMVGGTPARLLKSYSHKLDQWVISSEQTE